MAMQRSLWCHLSLLETVSLVLGRGWGGLWLKNSGVQDLFGKLGEDPEPTIWTEGRVERRDRREERWGVVHSNVSHGLDELSRRGVGGLCPLRWGEGGRGRREVQRRERWRWWLWRFEVVVEDGGERGGVGELLHGRDGSSLNASALHRGRGEEDLVSQLRGRVARAVSGLLRVVMLATSVKTVTVRWGEKGREVSGRPLTTLGALGCHRLVSETTQQREIFAT
jgi:hypothetical protein